MKVQLKQKEPLINASYKIPPHIKNEIEEIAAKESVTKGELVRGFLTLGLEAYHAGKVHRVWGETMMNHFRKQVKSGDTVIAGGIRGVVKGREEMFLKLEIADGLEIRIVEDELTDVMNPSKELMAEMQRFQKSLKGDSKVVID